MRLGPRKDSLLRMSPLGLSGTGVPVSVSIPSVPGTKSLDSNIGSTL